MDGISYTHIFTVGNEVHEGWNTYDYTESPLKYRYYTINGDIPGACNIGEVVLLGVEAIDSTSDEYSCSPYLVFPGDDGLLGTDDDSRTEFTSGSVNYKASLTSVIDSITPRYGSVLGGTIVTFTGSNLPNSGLTIEIDEVECTIISSSSDAIQCQTGDRPGLYPDTRLDMIVPG